MLYTHFLWVDNSFSKKGIFTSIFVKETPVHLQVPNKGIARADEIEDNPQVEEHLGVTVVFSWKREEQHTSVQLKADCFLKQLQIGRLDQWNQHPFYSSSWKIRLANLKQTKSLTRTRFILSFKFHFHLIQRFALVIEVCTSIFIFSKRVVDLSF